ncbi:BnaCnng47620D [Brassica napus]|uniref:BnaCnng47620D protein n=2 Tax=Brassica TaxID=3705 RepID=A0A078JD52_BRANA|nr:BnaCnng47620D [Brassica napus]
MSKICNTWNYVSNHSSDEDGRIVLIWKDPLRLQVVKQSRQSMTCTLTLPNKEPVYFTSV